MKKCTCYENAKRILPHLTDTDIDRVIWNATAFPAAECEKVEKQLNEYVGMSCDEILRKAYAETDDAMNRMKKERKSNDES